MSFDADEYCEVWSEKIRRARKEHECSACKETIRRGDLYSYTFSVFEGSAQDALRRCARCEIIYRSLINLHSEHGIHSGVHPELDCGHSFREIFSEDPPPELARLAFLTASEAQAELAEL